MLWKIIISFNYDMQSVSQFTVNSLMSNEDEKMKDD